MTTETTPAPVGYESHVVKTVVDGQERFALACLLRALGKGTSQASFARHVLLVGMECLGYNEERRIEEYAEYRLRCLREGVRNPYENRGQ